MFNIYKSVEESLISHAENEIEKHRVDIHNEKSTINKAMRKEFPSKDDVSMAFFRSWDSVLGGVWENVAYNISESVPNRETYGRIEGTIYQEQIDLVTKIAGDRRDGRVISLDQYKELRNIKSKNKSYMSLELDCYWNDGSGHYICEIKSGGFLDKKKAHGEYTHLLLAYAILSNIIPKTEDIHIVFGVAYNKEGYGKQWKCGPVQKMFLPEEIFVSVDFWNLISGRNDGYSFVKKGWFAVQKQMDDAKSKIIDMYMKKQEKLIS